MYDETVKSDMARNYVVLNVVHVCCVVVHK